MRSVQTSYTFPLSSVKPLDRLLRYRAYCLEETRKALQASAQRREQSPVRGARLEPFGYVEGLEYLRCAETGSIFLAEVSASLEWARLLRSVSRYRHSPRAFHSDIAKSRSDNVYLPKLEWIQSTIRLQGLDRPRLMEVVSSPSDLTTLLKGSGLFADVRTIDEMELAMSSSLEHPPKHVRSSHQSDLVQAAILLESLDRVDNPAALLRGVARCLTEGGLVFITALVCSGFDMAVLGVRNFYLYPPDRTNCFSLDGLERLLADTGFTLLEVSTPGVLDLEIVQAHLRHDPAIPLSTFEGQILAADVETHTTFQEFLQERRLSSFARIVGRKQL